MSLLTVYPANIQFLFLDDELVKKYHIKLGVLVLLKIVSPKREVAEIEEECKVIRRQLLGRKIQLYKASKKCAHG